MDGLKARLSFDAVVYDYDDEYLTIDTDTHTININNVSRLFGVQYDGNSKLIKFRIRNKLSDIQKMQDSIVYINWIDSRGVKGQSIAINKSINNDTCEFAWKVPFDALKNSGVLHFAMSAVVTKNSSSVIDQRWSTQIASVITPDGIYIKSYTPSSEEEDRIAQIYNELSNMINKQNNNLQSQVNSLKEDIAFVTDERISPSMTNFVVDGRQLFNKDGKLINGYYNNGEFVERSDMAGHFIKIKGGSNICASGAFFYGATFDANRKLIKEYLNVADGSHITVEQNAVWLYVATSTQVLDHLVVSYGDAEGNPIGNYWDRTFYVEGKYIDGVTPHKVYNLPYIQNCRVKCNGGSDTVTAYYAGVDCKKTVNIIQCRWIWERGSNTGTLALIINPNGVRYIKDITASSLHLQVRNNQIKLDVLGVKYGNYYYQNIIDKTLDTIMPLDNKTEHIVSLVAIGNECIVTLDGTEYKGTFIPDDKITSLNEILGQYATFEHFCQGKRESYAMPQITQFIVRATDEYIVDDDFQRQDGQLQNTPQGIPYCLISTLSNRG